MIQLREGEVTATNVLTRLLRLSQLTGGFLCQDDSDRPISVSEAKLKALSDIVDSAAEDERKLVVIARFLPEIDAIRRMLEKKRINYSVISGEIQKKPSSCGGRSYKTERTAAICRNWRRYNRRA